MAQDVYELHVLRGGRWTVAEKYTHLEKETALNDAKQASGSADAVKLIRESFDEGDGTFKQRTLYRYAKPGVPEAKGSAAAAAPAGGRAAPARAPVKMASPERTQRPVAVPIAGRTAPKVAEVERGRPVAISGAEADPAGAPIAMPRARAGLSVLLVPLLATVVVGVGALVTLGFDATSLSVSGMPRNVMLLVLGGVFGATALVTWLVGGRGRRAGLPDGIVLVEVPDAAASDGAAAGKSATTAPAPAAAVAAPQTEATPPSAPAADPAAAGSTIPVDHMRTAMARFLQDSLGEDRMRAWIAQTGFDSRGRFGAHLYLLGAGDAMIAASRGSPDMLLDLLPPVLEPLGSDAARARAFIDKADEYRRPPQYQMVIGSGNAAMRSFLGGRPAEPGLYAALMAWNQAEGGGSPSEDANLVAIMFTDMVSSVQTTQRLGDEGAMTLVQAHNLIVGAALKRCRGHVVKHTGDGIMAAFPRVGDSVVAAAQILRELDSHNRVTMGEPLQIRIGVSAGRTIRENDDYFGTVVQLAARLCAAAGTGEALVSDQVAEAAAGVVGFSERRIEMLKGFQEPQGCRTVIWGGGSPASGGASFAAAS